MRATLSGIPVAALLLAVTGCGPSVQTQSWVSRSSPHSAYQATLTETSYNGGESIIYDLRIDALPLGNDRGWFYHGAIDGGGIISESKPDLKWISRNDLLVVVHTEDLRGETRRGWHGYGAIDAKGRARPEGSVTIRYVPDQQPR